MIQWWTVFYSRLSSWKYASPRHSPCVCRSTHSDAAIDDKNPPQSSEVQDPSASAWYLVSTCARRSPSVCLLRDGSLLFVKVWWCSEGRLPPPTPSPSWEAWQIVPKTKMLMTNKSLYKISFSEITGNNAPVISYSDSLTYAVVTCRRFGAGRNCVYVRSTVSGHSRVQLISKLQHTGT